MPQIRRVAIQTNLSTKLDWLAACDMAKVGLWCTFHPSETTRERFLAKCNELRRHGVRFSVGVVGLKEHLGEIEALRRELSDDVYLWVNAFKRESDYYSSEMVESLTRVDHLFPINNQYHASRGFTCQAGHTVITVDGDGTIRRCHFVKEPIGNIYSADFETCLKHRPCPNDTCGCHIGYVHLNRLELSTVFGDGILERIPVFAERS